MATIPEFLEKGEIARLIPIVADTSKEQRIVSATLAVMSAVPAYAKALLGHFGLRVGVKSRINTFTEIGFRGDTGEISGRPDGLIEVHNIKSSWYGIIEAKIGSQSLQKEQIERYLALARNNNINAVITISNDFSSRPDHHPLKISNQLLKKVEIFHISWKSILTEALLIYENGELIDPEQAFLLRELIRFLSHDSSGVESYTRMPAQWKEFVANVAAGVGARKTDPVTELIVAGWNQEIRDLALQMSQKTNRKVSLVMSRAEEHSTLKHLQTGIATLVQENQLIAKLRIPDTASDFLISADLKSRTIQVSMLITAPVDRKTTKSRLNWLLRQLAKSDPEGIAIKLKWPSRAMDTVFSLKALQESPLIADQSGGKSPARAFEIAQTFDSPRRFVGRETFIQEIENIVPQFYENIGQHIQAWQPKPPKIRNSGSEPAEVLETAISINNKLPPTGNDHTNLIELPPFLIRPSNQI